VSIEHRATASIEFPHGVVELDAAGMLRTATTLFWLKTRSDAEAWAEKEQYQHPAFVEMAGLRPDPALLVRAAEFLEQDCAELTLTHTVGGEWPESEFEVLAHVEDIKEAAKAVRQVISGRKS
jgi:hypothetical protein